MSIGNLIAYARANKRICPMPDRWHTLWEMLPKEKTMGVVLPSLPLILGGRSASNAEKKKLFELHLRWANTHGALDAVDEYVRGLPEEDWHHECDSQVGVKADDGMPIPTTVDEFCKRVAEREFRRFETSKLEMIFDVLRGQTDATSVYFMWAMLLELEHRKRWRMNDTRLTRAGKLYEAIDYRLDELSTLGFVWPFTEVTGGDGILDSISWRLDSPLSRMGYTVKQDGPSDQHRQMILRKAFEESVPTKGMDEEGEWGKPKTAVRLRKLANFLAAQIRNNTRRTKPPRNAIVKWQSDLEWLRRSFYDGTAFSFPWPK
jgi:hypothetical protein